MQAGSSANNNIPWVEKYRPTEFSAIVLDQCNKKIMTTMLATNRFPNMLLYGPPGTGKTTTIINLVNAYQQKQHQKGKGLMIHLNASDERGIDIVRNQILQFVNSKSLFNDGLKFVILDEVDYMTKNAQQALKYLLQGFNNNVRFCLICNYISRIDESLQNEFMRIRFNQLPVTDIVGFLAVINDKEKLHLTADNIAAIQNLYKSDIRSMINYMQSNQNSLQDHKVITNSTMDQLTVVLASDVEAGTQMLEQMSANYNLDTKNIIKSYLVYLIRNKPEYITDRFLKFTEFVMHIDDANVEYIKRYTVASLNAIFQQ
jgi:DNA polymerase III delta prime subunit